MAQYGAAVGLAFAEAVAVGEEVYRQRAAAQLGAIGRALERAAQALDLALAVVGLGAVERERDAAAGNADDHQHDQQFDEGEAALHGLAIRGEAGAVLRAARSQCRRRSLRRPGGRRRRS